MDCELRRNPGVPGHTAYNHLLGRDFEIREKAMHPLKPLSHRVTLMKIARHRMLSTESEMDVRGKLFEQRLKIGAGNLAIAIAENPFDDGVIHVLLL